MRQYFKIPYLQVPLDMTQQRNVTDASYYEQEQGTGEYQDCERSGDGETRGDQVVTCKVFPDVPPRALVQLG